MPGGAGRRLAMVGFLGVEGQEEDLEVDLGVNVRVKAFRVLAFQWPREWRSLWM